MILGRVGFTTCLVSPGLFTKHNNVIILKQYIKYDFTGVSMYVCLITGTDLDYQGLCRARKTLKATVLHVDHAKYNITFSSGSTFHSTQGIQFYFFRVNLVLPTFRHLNAK